MKLQAFLILLSFPLTLLQARIIEDIDKYCRSNQDLFKLYVTDYVEHIKCPSTVSAYNTNIVELYRLLSMLDYSCTNNKPFIDYSTSKLSSFLEEINSGKCGSDRLKQRVEQDLESVKSDKIIEIANDKINEWIAMISGGSSTGNSTEEASKVEFNKNQCQLSGKKKRQLNHYLEKFVDVPPYKVFGFSYRRLYDHYNAFVDAQGAVEKCSNEFKEEFKKLAQKNYDEVMTYYNNNIYDRDMLNVSAFRPPYDVFRVRSSMEGIKNYFPSRKYQSLDLSRLTDTVDESSLTQEEKRSLSTGKQSQRARKQACTSIDNRKLPLLSRGDRGEVIHHNRNQGSTGWCFAFSAADLLSFKYGDFYSTLDLVSNYYIPEGDPTKFSEYMGGFIEDALKVVGERGICLEKEVPATIDHQTGIDYQKIIRSIESLQADLDNDEKIVEFACREDGAWLANLLPNLNVQDFIDIIKGKDNKGPSLIRNLINEACKNRFTPPKNFSEKIAHHPCYEGMNGIPADLMFSKQKPAACGNAWDILNKQLEQGNIVGYSFDIGVLYDQFDHEPSFGHAVTIVGREFNIETNKCEYIVRNSQGRDCDLKGGFVPYDKSYKCEQGNLWIPEEHLIRKMSSITYLKD